MDQEYVIVTPYEGDGVWEYFLSVSEPDLVECNSDLDHILI